MTAPRVEVDLDAITANTRTLLDRLAPIGIRVTGVTKAALGSPDIAAAMEAGGVAALGDSRVDNLRRLRDDGPGLPLTLVRSPMRSQAAAVVGVAGVSLNSEAVVLGALAAAARDRGIHHAALLMVELGDLREGVPAADLIDLARHVLTQPGLRLAGIGTNLACQAGATPDQAKMDELSLLADRVEATLGTHIEIVSGGNSANLDWALSTGDPGRVNDLRLGESILLGTEPLRRRSIAGLRTDAFELVAEVIEVQTKPAQPWGDIAQAAFGPAAKRMGTGSIRQAIVALGRQDADPADLMPPTGITVLGMSSDHLVLDVSDRDVEVGQELTFQPGYSSLVRAMTSPYVSQIFAGRR
ncbi:MAG: alanine/ornithine racemase family PLP-dependent enzyme [Acidimicrobiales bacterium]|nr:alanine/ornithine racemase family PLP-dependent enzyme [Acidimicrobiales bacterium]